MNLISTELADDTLELYLKRFAYVALINKQHRPCLGRIDETEVSN